MIKQENVTNDLYVLISFRQIKNIKYGMLVSTI